MRRPTGEVTHQSYGTEDEALVAMKGSLSLRSSGDAGMLASIRNRTEVCCVPINSVSPREALRPTKGELAARCEHGEPYAPDLVRLGARFQPLP